MVQSIVHMIIDYLGGQSNIEDFTIDQSNIILFRLKDMNLVDLLAVKDSREVTEVLHQGQNITLHIQDALTPAFAEILIAELMDEPEEKIEKKEAKKKNILSAVMDALQGIFAPILAPLAGAGILQGITILLATLELIPTGNAEEGILLTISNAVFYFMPILLAYSSANYFGASPCLAATVAGFLIHPELIEAL